MAARHTGQIAETGFFKSAAGQIPVVVTRATESCEPFNVCRHRGHIVANGSGARESLQCPYHAWTYGLDGKLRAAPRSDREPGFDTHELGLRQIQVDTFGPMVFVNPNPDGPPLAEALGDVPAQLAEILDVDALEFRFRAEFELDTNWKISCENFLECYHCAVAHPGFSAAVDVSPDAYDSKRTASCPARSARFGKTATRSSRTARCRAASFTSYGRTSA
jgi:choline monooxygenase